MSRITALVLVVPLGVLGVPVGVYASDGPEPVEQAHSVLTLDGRPIGEIRATATDYPDRAFRFAGMAPAEQSRPSSGQVSGVALDEDGQPLAGRAVRLMLAAREAKAFLGVPLSGPRAARVVRRTISDANGQFQFAGLSPGRYVVEVRVANKVGISPVMTLRDGMMAVRGITVSLADRPPGSLGRGAAIAIGIAVVGAIGAALVLGMDCHGLLCWGP